MNPAVIFAQGFLDVHELSVVRNVCREWRDNLADVFAYDVKRVFPKLVEANVVAKAIAFAKHICMSLDGQDPQDLVDAVQHAFLHGAAQLPSANIETLVCRIMFEGYTSRRDAFHSLSLLRCYACRDENFEANDKELTQRLVEKKLVMIAHDAPKQVVVDCFEFMTRLEHGIWVCATLEALLNTAIGGIMARNEAARDNIKSHLDKIIEVYADNAEVVKVAKEIKKRLE